MSESICMYCGGTIIFRYVGGVKTPIHLSGGCSESGSSSSASSNIKGDDFCRLTTCPRCTDFVYFIRHNGGSVWVDELGWPWPKHKCFVTQDSPQEAFAQFSSIHKVTPDITIGVVVEVIHLHNRNETVVKIAIQHREIVDVIVKGITKQSLRVNELVCISKKRQLLTHPETGSYEILLIKTNKERPSNHKPSKKGFRRSK